MTSIACLSDTHNKTVEIPDADILIHAGDCTINGTPRQLKLFSDWFSQFPHKYKILIAGNHDWIFQTNYYEALYILDPSITYLEDSLVEIEGLRIYGSPWTPVFNDWAFNLERGQPLKEVWKKMPYDLDVLITHGPPYEILDRPDDGIPVGDVDLLEAVIEKKPKYHIFGHIHESYGSRDNLYTYFVNVCMCTNSYNFSTGKRKAIIIDL
jgi:predicted phosphodiesterase